MEGNVKKSFIDIHCTRLEAFRANVSDKILPRDQSCQFGAEGQRFGELFFLHHQGVMSLVMETRDALRNVGLSQQTDAADHPR
jgi:hypothetical protein